MVDPEPRAHDGHDWLYVLSGQMRLVLGAGTGFSGREKSQSSTPKSRIGSEAPAKHRLRY